MRKLLILPVIAMVAFAAAAVTPPNIERALTAQQGLVQREPTAEHWNDLGNLQQLAGRTAEASQSYDRALALDPKLASAHYNLALLLRQGGEGRKALQHLRSVVQLQPKDAWAWFQIGSIYEARDSDGPAVRAYARAFALDPRLSFTDVNPQLIDSRLTTASLLRAEQERPQGADAARAYEDPRNVAKLLLPHLPAGDAAASTAGQPATSATASAGSANAATSPAGSSARVLRPEDLRAGQTAGGVTGAGRSASGREMTSPSPGYSDLLRQQLELQQQQEQEQLDQEQQRQLEGGEAPAPGIYVPGVRSSGQLEQRLDDMLGR